MSITTKTVVVPESKREVTDTITCDFCGATTTNDENWGKPSNTAKLATTVMLEDGYNSPDGGCGERTILDICPSCFETKLLEWAKSQGANPRTEKWDW